MCHFAAVARADSVVKHPRDIPCSDTKEVGQEQHRACARIASGEREQTRKCYGIEDDLPYEQDDESELCKRNASHVLVLSFLVGLVSGVVVHVLLLLFF